MKHKICIYAIARNEEQFVDRFCDAAAEADYIAVLDTGSTDRTVEKLSDRGVIVRQTTIEPWRFDVARNLSLLLIPRDTDLCVCVDLDEVLLPGWRAALEKAWTEDGHLSLHLLAQRGRKRGHRIPAREDPPAEVRNVEVSRA